MPRLLPRLVARTTETLLPKPTVRRLRDARPWKRWIQRLTPDLLEDLGAAPATVKRELFKRNVNLVEIETHARCNRICSFCPNVIVDRRRNRTRANAEMLDRVFEQLGSIDYRGQIKVARYSEPLADIPFVVDRIESARRRVPHAELAIVTNTDYLKRPVLDRLRAAGLNVVYMSLYLRDREVWSVALARQYTRDLARRLEVRIRSEDISPVGVRCILDYQGMILRSTCMNFGNYGTDRGAVMEQYMAEERIGPCREPFETFVIDYDGAVMPCCNLRHDLPAHRGMEVGDLSDPAADIFDIYAGRLAGWRRSMVGMGRKDSPCTTCRHRDVPGDLVPLVAHRLRRRLHRIGCSAYWDSSVEPSPPRAGVVDAGI